MANRSVRKSTSEHSLQRLIHAHCNILPNAFIWRANTGLACSRDGKVIRFGIPGQSDLMGVVNGRSVFIEVKSKKGIQSDEQKQFQYTVTVCGGIYILAKDFEETMAVVKEIAARSKIDIQEKIDATQ